MNVGKELQFCFYGLKPTLRMEQEIANDFLEHHFVPFCGCCTLSFRISISSIKIDSCLAILAYL